MDDKIIWGAILKFQGMVPAIQKDSTNPHFKSKYAALEDIQDTIKDALQSCGLAVAHIPTTEESLRVVVCHAESGQKLEGTIPLKIEKATAQGWGSAMTYARRYSLVAILGLNVGGEDDDGNTASQPKAEAKPRTSATDIKKLGEARIKTGDWFMGYVRKIAKAADSKPEDVMETCIAVVGAWVEETFKFKPDENKTGLLDLTLEQHKQFHNSIQAIGDVVYYPWETQVEVTE